MRHTKAKTAVGKKKPSLAQKGRGRGKRSVSGADKKADNVAKSTQQEPVLDLDINGSSAADFFTKNATFAQHYDAQQVNRDRYVATALACVEYSIEMLGNARARSLAAAWARHDHELADYYLFSMRDQFGLSDVLKAATLLDSKRERRAIEKRLTRGVASSKLGALKNDMNNLARVEPKCGSLSGALSRHIRRWTRTFSEADLEHFALNMSTEPWRKLANLVHLHPSKDFPAAPWFLAYCYEASSLPPESKIAALLAMNGDNVNELIGQYGDSTLTYSTKVREHRARLTEASKAKLANSTQTKLDTILWYFEDLRCANVSEIVLARLERGDRLELPYGKLMERLIMFRLLRDTRVDTESILGHLMPLAERRLAEFKATLAAPVAVLGDASSSMDVAIQTATIISSLLSAICGARLTFFNHANFGDGDESPRNVQQALDMAIRTRASGSTAPAASLVPYYDARQVVKTFIIVTDEEENTDAHTADKRSWRFYDLFMAYRRDVYPASLIFVSFLHSQHTRGQMYERFERDAVSDVVQFKFDRARPDLTKLDNMLGSICSKSSQSFGGCVERIESEIKMKGLVAAMQKI